MTRFSAAVSKMTPETINYEDKWEIYCYDEDLGQ